MIVNASNLVRSPAPWPWQPALFPGLADPGAVLWAADKPPAVNREGIAYGYKELALSIFYQAVIDAQAPGFEGQQARAWLAESGLELLTLAGVGIRPAWYSAWLANGCPVKKWMRLSDSVVR